MGGYVESRPAVWQPEDESDGGARPAELSAKDSAALGAFDEASFVPPKEEDKGHFCATPQVQSAAVLTALASVATVWARAPLRGMSVRGRLLRCRGVGLAVSAVTRAAL
eukprot:2597099-Pyramimonas_sp.AAC.1